MQIYTDDDQQATGYVQSITYDAKGQRQTITYGNNTTTSYTYDPKTYAVTRIYTVNSSGGSLQDLNYTYDPVGNILSKIDVAQDVVYYNNQQVLAAGIYKYDSLYQLITAQGRQLVGNSSRIDLKKQKSWKEEIYNPYHAPKDVQALEAYIEQYTYDNGGNLTKLQHSAVSGSWTRNMIVSNKTNRAVSDRLAIGITPDDVDNHNFFDLNGNQLQLTGQHFLQWNETNNIRQYITVSRVSGNNDGEYYVYDSAGQRVRKVAVTYGTGETMRYTKETIYLGSIEIKRSTQASLNSGVWSDEAITEEYHTLSIADDTRAIANRHYWLIGSPPSGATSPIVFYSLSDHLGSATLDVSTSGTIVSVEEYTPYGDSSLFLGTGSALALKTKRYSGKEKDATGLYYYGARYFDPTLMRWLSPDPIGPIDGPNIYLFLNGNPVNSVDMNGNEGGKEEEKAPDPQPKPKPQQVEESKTSDDQSQSANSQSNPPSNMNIPYNSATIGIGNQPIPAQPKPRMGPAPTKSEKSAKLNEKEIQERIDASVFIPMLNGSLINQQTGTINIFHGTGLTGYIRPGGIRDTGIDHTKALPEDKNTQVTEAWTASDSATGNKFGTAPDVALKYARTPTGLMKFGVLLQIDTGELPGGPTVLVKENGGEDIQTEKFSVKPIINRPDNPEAKLYAVQTTKVFQNSRVLGIVAPGTAKVDSVLEAMEQVHPEHIDVAAVFGGKKQFDKLAAKAQDKRTSKDFGVLSLHLEEVYERHNAKYR